MKKCLLFLLLSGIRLSEAQQAGKGDNAMPPVKNFTWQCTVDSVFKSGLHKMELSHGLMGKSEKDLHDLRLADSSGHEYPYVILSEPLLRSQSDFVPYPVVSVTHYNKQHYRFFFFHYYTEVTIENPARDKINNLSLNVNNSDAYKYCAVEGSDDQKNWYSVSEQQELSLAYDNNYTNTYKCIYFPANNYRYFRLIIDDRYQRPFKINAAGQFKNTLIAGKLNGLQHTITIRENEKEKQTLLELDFGSYQLLNRIAFHIKSPRLFKRSARIYATRQMERNHQIVNEKVNVYELDLDASGRLFFDLPYVHEKRIWIEIDNKDNPPLEIDSISCSRLATYLIADLNKGTRYFLKGGDSTLNVPEYDLINFVNDVPQLMPRASLGKLTPIAPVTVPVIASSKPFYEEPWFMWVCIGAGALILMIFSVNLLKDMKQGEHKNNT